MPKTNTLEICTHNEDCSKKFYNLSAGWMKDVVPVGVPDSGIVTVNVLTFETDEDETGSTNFVETHVPLNSRSHVNRFIRDLRKARDEAFGRDE